MQWQIILAIGSGGFLGAVLRAYLNIIINEKFPSAIPLSTFSVNILGSFLIGVLFALFYETDFFHPYAKSFLIAGFLGSLTTYSTFAIETLFLFHEDLLLGFLNILMNVVGTILMAFIGFKSITYLFNT